MESRSTNRRAKRARSSCRSAKRSRLVAIPHSCRSSSPPPTPTHSHACRAGPTGSPRNCPPAQSADRPIGYRIHCNWRDRRLSRSPSYTPSASQPAPRTPIPIRSAVDRAFSSSETATVHSAGRRPISRRSQGVDPAPSPYHRQCSCPVDSCGRARRRPTARKSPHTCPLRRALLSSPGAVGPPSPSGTSPPAPPPSPDTQRSRAQPRCRPSR